MNISRVSLSILALMLLFLLGCSEDAKEINNIKLAKFYIAQNNDVLASQILTVELKAGKNLQEAHRLMGKLLNEGEFYGDAVSHYQSAIELGCQQACNEGLIDAYLGLGEFSKAEQEFSLYISDKNSKSSKFRLILIEFFKSENYQQTINRLEEIDLPTAKYWILKLMYEQGRYLDITASFDKAADYSERQLLIFAQAHYLLKQYKKSDDILLLLRSDQSGQLLTKKKIQIIDLLVKVNTALGRNENAKLIYEEFLKNNEGTGYVSFKNALANLRKANFDGAIDDIGNLANSFPENNQIVLALAMAQFGKKDYQEVITSLGNIKGGHNEHVLTLLASAYNKIGRPQETINLLKGIEKDSMLTVLLSRAYFLKKDYKISRFLLDNMVIDLKSDPVNQKLARLWFDLGQFNKIISNFSGDSSVPATIKYLVVSSYLKLGKIPLARQYISNEPVPDLSREMLAYIERKAGDLDKAIQIYSDLVLQKPSKKYHILLALSYIKNNDYSAALKAIQAGTRLDGDNQVLLNMANRIMLQRNNVDVYRWLDTFETDHRDYKKNQKMLANYEILQNQSEKAEQRLAPFIDDGDRHVYFLMALAKKDSDLLESVRLMEKSLSTEFSVSAASRLQKYYLQINDTNNLERINTRIERAGGINNRTAELLTKGYLFLQAYDKANELAIILTEQGQPEAGEELLGDILAHQGKYDEAVAAYKPVMSNNASEKLLIKFFTSKIKANDENVLAVLSEGDDRLVKFPKMHGLRKFIGTRYIDRNNNAAIAHLKILIDEFPNDIVLLNNLAWANLKLDPVSALKYSSEAYRISSDNFNIIDTHVRALKKNNQIDSARDLLGKKISENPDNPKFRSLMDVLN